MVVTPRFSIAIPVLGQQGYLPTALKSIRVQHAQYELAVMDATPDGSVQAILDHYAEIITYRRHGPDKGQSAAIQEGWNQTSGEFVAWLCADDYYFPDTLQAVQEVFCSNPDVDVVYGDSVYVDERGHFRRYFPSIRDTVERLPYDDCIAQPSCFVRRRAIDRIGGLRSSLHYVMDWDLWTRLYEDGAGFRYLKKPLSVTRVYGDTKTSSMALRRYREAYGHLKRHTTPLRSVRSLLGMLRYDLRGGQTKTILRVLNPLFDMATDLKKAVSAPPDGASLYGLTTWGNGVHGGCRVFLPWYEEKSPSSVVVEADRPLSLELTVNDLVAQPVERCGIKHIFRFPGVAQDGVDALSLCCAIESESQSWRLGSVALV